MAEKSSQGQVMGMHLDQNFSFVNYVIYPYLFAVPKAYFLQIPPLVKASTNLESEMTHS